jgi:hypothetical protein
MFIFKGTKNYRACLKRSMEIHTERSFAKLLSAPRIVRAMLTISSKGIDLLCLMFFSFFLNQKISAVLEPSIFLHVFLMPLKLRYEAYLSRGGSFKALITNELALGTTETVA